MITIISGTHRNHSMSRNIADCYANVLEKMAVKHTVLDLKDVPQQFLFNAMFEMRGKNNEFNTFAHILKASEKFIFVVPEYNGSFPGVLKTFIDAMDFPSSFKDKKCALVGISSGSMAGALATSHLTDILNYLGMHVLAMKIRISKVESIYANGKITDSFIADLLQSQAEALMKF